MLIRQNNGARLSFVAILLLLCGLLSLDAGAQTSRPGGGSQQQPSRRPVSPTTRVIGPEQRVAPVSRDIDRFCAGFIEHEAAGIGHEVVGGEQEQEQHTYAEGDYVFINAGASNGMVAGQEFSVVRPRGRFKSEFSRKEGTLGVFMQEIGRVRLTEVKSNVSVAQVTNSCEMMLLGDVLRALPPPLPESSLGVIAQADALPAPLPRSSEPTGRQQGRIVMARDLREMVSRNQVVYIDLGREDNIKAGDTLSVYRPLGHGVVARIKNEEITQNTHGGFESEEFRGGKFSNKAQRAQRPNGTGTFDQRPVTSPQVKDARPAMPRKVVGEIVVLKVEQRTATAIITRVSQEIHTGDFVEVQ
ncbi:MAG TPA: hypothetical protein VGB73_14480 [Pyrinomonadaceae bacterium]